MRVFLKAVRLGALAAFTVFAGGTSVRSEPALDRVLATVKAANQKRCTALNIAFNLRVRYISHFPVAAGQELRIALKPIDGAQAAAEILSRRESLRAPETKFGHIRAIDFEAGGAAGPTLTIQFDQAVSYDVAQGDDFQSLVVKIYGKGGRGECRADFTGQNSIGGWTTSVMPDVTLSDGAPSGRPLRRGKGTATEVQRRQAATLLDEGRAALRKGDTAAAIAKFSQALKLPENEFSADTEEMLGVAQQKSKQLGEARVTFEDYLSRYPSGEGADRVRQRLDGIVTASGNRGGPDLRAPKGAATRDDGAQTWTVSGSASQFYIRDDSFRTLRDPSLPLIVNEDLDSHQTHQNELLSSLDVMATWTGNGVRNKLRFSGTEEHKFENDQDEIVGVAALYLDTAVRDWGLETRIGRQTRNTGGVLGRFDGAVVSFQAAQPFRLNLVAGSPVLRRRDEPYLDEKLFYGVSADFGPFDGFDFSLFYIEQRDRSILDRRAVGAEARYTDVQKSAFASVDYDVEFGDLNAALINGSWTLADKSTLHAAFDYRRSPYFSLWTALQGQAFPTLYEMLKAKTLAQIEDLAADRSATFTSASAGFSRPINDTFQVSFDATMTNLSGTPASGGVTGTESTGNEFFYSAQLIGNGVVTADDLVIAGLRFADLDRSNYYVADLSFRYPLMDQLKINPRLMLAYRTGDTTDLIEYTVLPSVLFNYYFTRDLSLELEVGAQWTDSKENGITETTTDLFFTVGYRYDFYADGTVLSPSRAAPYGAGAPMPSKAN